MKKYEKIIIFIDVILTIFYSVPIVLSYSSLEDGIGVLFGSLLFLFLFSYFISFIFSKFSKLDNKKLALWKVFIKIYPALLILVIIGTLNK
jgi:hypothetical protein